MTPNVLAKIVNSTTQVPWHVGLTPTFPSSLLLSNNATIETLLSDIPFLGVGLLAFAILTFLLVVKRFDMRTIPIFLSPVLAFIAVVLDIDQLLVQNSPGTANASGSSNHLHSTSGLTIPLSSVLPLLVAREVFLALSFGMRFLYLWIYLCYDSAKPPTNGNDTEKVITRNIADTGSSPGYVKGPYTSLPPFLVFGFKYTFLVFVLSVPILQLLWRLVRKFNRHGGIYVADSVIEISVSSVAIVALVVRIVVDGKHAAWSTCSRSESNTDPASMNEKNRSRLSIGIPPSNWKKTGRWKIFNYSTPVIFSVLVGLGVGIGNLMCFEFSESSLGRLFQALELYIWILYITISTFYHERKGDRGFSRLEEFDNDIKKEDKDQVANQEERTPATTSSFNIQPDTPQSLLPTSAFPLTRNYSKRRSTRLTSWLSSIRTNRDNGTDSDTAMLSMPGSSILSPSTLPKGRMSSWLSGNFGSARNLKSKSGLLSVTGGRIRSVSWDMFNAPLEGGEGEKDGTTSIVDTKTSLVSNQGVSGQSQTHHRNSLQSRGQVTRVQTPPLASRLERLAMQLESISGKRQETNNETTVSFPNSTSRFSTSLALQPEPGPDSDGFRLTPTTFFAPEMARSSYPYNSEVDPASYSRRSSFSYAKPVLSPASMSLTENEFLRQQRAELDMSVAGLKYFESAVDEASGDIEDSDDSHGTWKDTMMSDFLFSKFPEPPKGHVASREDDPSNFTNGNEGPDSSLLHVNGDSPELPPIHRYSPSLETPLSFPSPMRRASEDSSVLGVNEGALTLGLDLDGVVPRGGPGARQLDVTSFIATGGGRIDSSQSHLRPPVAPAFSRFSLADTEDADGDITPSGAVVSFAKLVHVPPVASAPVTISRSPSGSRNTEASDLDLMTTTPPQTFQQRGQTVKPSTRPMRRNIGIGLPSSVKLKSSNLIPTPNTVTYDLEDVGVRLQ